MDEKAERPVRPEIASPWTKITYIKNQPNTNNKRQSWNEKNNKETI